MKRLFLLSLILIMAFHVESQETTPPADCASLNVSNIDPDQVVQGRAGNFRLNGSGFSNSTQVELRGFGALSVTSVTDTSLVVAVPATVALGRYDVLVDDATLPLCAAVTVPVLRIVAPNVPQPTALPPSPFPTLAPPTPIPGQPSLIVSQYSATPTRVRQGGVVSFTITVVNQGNRSAESVTAAFEGSGALIPSGTQTSAILGSIPPNGSTTFVLSAIASSDAPGGTNNISLGFSYRDFENNNYTSQASLSVEVESVAQISQLSLRGYTVNPDPVQPAAEVTLELTLTNTGTETASQLQLTVPVGSGVLLAGPLGNSFPLGSIAPRTDIIANLPLIVSSTAPAGVQSQPLTLSYIQDGSPQTTEINITLTVDTPLSSSILLDSYDIGRDNVQAGERFTLTARLSNVGTAAVKEALVSFRSTPTTNANGDNPNGSSLFAPLGGGGSIFLGDIPPDSSMTFSQEFIVSGTAESGIYSLPIVVRYIKPDGSPGEETLNASIVVLVPPLLRFIEQQPVPEVSRIGNTIDLSLSIQNLGQRDVRLLSARIIADSFDIFTGEETLLQTLRAGEETLLEATLVPAIEGQGTIRIELLYLDDLNQESTIVQEYPVEILAAPPPPPTEEFVEQQPIETSTPEPQSIVLPEDFWGRLLLGFLGIGN